MDYHRIPAGALRDAADPRDYRKALAGAPGSLPERATITHQPPIKNQGYQGSCTGHAATWFWEQILRSRGMLSETLSPLYVWYWGREMEGNAMDDTGVSMRGIMKALAVHGAPPLESFPYGMPVSAEPDQTARIYGEALRLPVYQRCDDLEAIKREISIENHGVVIGLPIYEGWSGNSMLHTGVCPGREWMGKSRGWHAMVISGYDDAKGRLTLANSWGPSYGDAGYVHLPYDYLDWEGFDAWGTTVME